jgi:hypothetical protein
VRIALLTLVAACGGAGTPPVDAPLATCAVAGEVIVVPYQSERLDGCAHVLGGVHVPDAQLEYLAPLASLRRIDERLSFFRGVYGDLTSLGDNLAYVGGELSVRITNALVSLEGLGGVREVGSLEIDFNAALVSLDGLASLERVHGDIEIIDNAALPQAAIDRFLARIEVGGAVVVSGNAR